MGLKDFFSRWRQDEDERAVERAKEEARMEPAERDFDQEDYEGRKEDLQTENTSYAGFDAADVARNELDDR